MTNARAGRGLAILSAILTVAALGVAITLFLLRSLVSRRFSDAILSARFALDEQQNARVQRELLRASRSALSAEQWREILQLSLTMVSENPEESNFRFFRILSGRAAAAIPGREDFLAYWTWALMRSGKSSQALKNIERLNSDKWIPIKAELRLKSQYGDEASALDELTERLLENPDPEFFAKAAMEAESAELSFDAALLYMLNGRPVKALEQSRIVAEGKRRWASPETPLRRGVAAANARIAHDAGSPNEAIEWLSAHVNETERRRAVSWENLQYLGDLAWERHALEHRSSDIQLARESWTKGKDIVLDSNATAPADGSWRLWLNLAVLEKTEGKNRNSDAILDEALRLFPEENEVKVAWATSNFQREPAISRRLVRQASDKELNPVLGIAALMLDPDALSPRLYESRLWELFESISSVENKRLHSPHSHEIASFVLDYLSSRKSFDSVDVAVDRYRKTYPDESWILSWRLAVDAVRGFPVVNLLSSREGRVSSYEEFRLWALSRKSWRSLHDCALYAYHAASEMKRFARNYDGNETSVSQSDVQNALVALLSESSVYSTIAASPIRDRINRIIELNPQTERFTRALRQNSKKGLNTRSIMRSALLQESGRLLENSLDDLILARRILGSQASNEDISELLFLEALFYQALDDSSNAQNLANQALELNPNNTRARALARIEVTP